VLVHAVVLRLVALPPAHDARLVAEVPVDAAEHRRRLDPDDLLVVEDAEVAPDALDVAAALVRPILAWLTIRNSVAKPSMRFSNNDSTASGVTSRPVKPVPPVEMITSTSGAAIHRFTCARIASTSSSTIARS
jgi:hypothetical protein